MKSTYGTLKKFLSVPNHLCFFTTRVLLGNGYYIVLVWFPYYFSKLGYQEESSNISIMFPITSCLGTLVLGAFVKKIPILHEVFISGFYIVNMAVIISFLIIERSVPVYIILSGAMGFLISYGYGYQSSPELG